MYTQLAYDMDFSLIQIQYFQHLHDSKYHLDIFSMPTFRRVAHLHQHLIKYSGTNRFEDAIACILSMANTLNIDIQKGLVKNFVNVTSFNEISDLYHPDVLRKQYDIIIKQIAKIIEGLDHVESINYRQDMEKHISFLLVILLQQYRQTMESSNHSLLLSWLIRLKEIKQKSIFYPFNHDSDLKDSTYISFITYYNTIGQTK